MNKLFIAIILLISFWCTAITAGAQSAETAGASTAVIKVGNLHCNNDMPTIKKQLLNQDGIEEVSFTGISNETATFTITYQQSATTREQIEKAIENTPGCDAQGEKPYRVKKQGADKKKRS